MKREEKKRMMFREGIIFLLRRNKTEVEKEKYIWRREIYFFRGVEKLERKIRNIFGDGKYVFFVDEKINGRGKGGRYVFCGGDE